MSVERCVTVMQRKGGVGKTAIVANTGGMAAAAGARVLLIDLDPQGNLARDLGFPRDSGEDLLTSFVTAAPMPVIKEVRTNLDVVPGGPAIGDVAALFASRVQRGSAGFGEVLESKLAAIADDYDLILIDTPPGDQIIVDGVLHTATSVIIPTRSDDGSIDGVEGVASLFATAHEHNPQLRLAGILLFGINSQSRRLARDVRNTLADIVGDAAPIFNTVIRYHETAAVDARRRGLLVHELKQAAKADKVSRIDALKAGERPVDSLYAQSPDALADNYREFTEEMLKRIAELEEERNPEEASA